MIILKGASLYPATGSSYVPSKVIAVPSALAVPQEIIGHVAIVSIQMLKYLFLMLS